MRLRVSDENLRPGLGMVKYSSSKDIYAGPTPLKPFEGKQERFEFYTRLDRKPTKGLEDKCDTRLLFAYCPSSITLYKLKGLALCCKIVPQLVSALYERVRGQRGREWVE